jgi:hypothetical protein
LLLVAALARIIHSLRRHRVDDVRGRYRVWRWIAAGALLGSVNAVVGVHQFIARAAVALGWSITALGASADALAGALPLVGHTLILAALMVYARYVVLDVQGLIEHKPRRPAASAAKARKPAAKTATTTAAPAVDSAPAAKAPSPQPKPAAAASTAAAAGWSEADEDDEDESAGRRLSKAERKRLRKLRQGRAA